MYLYIYICVCVSLFVSLHIPPFPTLPSLSYPLYPPPTLPSPTLSTPLSTLHSPTHSTHPPLYPPHHSTLPPLYSPYPLYPPPTLNPPPPPTQTEADSSWTYDAITYRHEYSRYTVINSYKALYNMREFVMTGGRSWDSPDHAMLFTQLVVVRSTGQ